MRTSSRLALARVAAAALLFALVLGTAVPVFAAPTNSAIEAKRKQANDAQAKLDGLQTDLEMRYEELAQIEGALEKTRGQIRVTEDDLERANQDLARSELQLSRRATSIYRNGRVDIIAVFVGAADFQDFISRLDIMRRIGRSDASLVAEVKDAKGRVETAKQALETREQEQVALRDEARAKKQEYEVAFNQQKSFLSTLTGELKKLIEQERIRQERLAAARAARAAAALKAKARANAIKLPFDPTKLGAAHPEVVSIARKYLGVEYVWGGSTPSGFDCSGLTWYCYGKIGIDLPRTSRSQFHAGAYIPPDRLDLLEPGDLVFFGYDGDPEKIHHVGIYVGGGDFLHAPASGDVVRIQSLMGRIESKGDYVGAVRP